MRLINRLKELRYHQSGVAAVEYGLIAALIVLAAMAGLAALGTENARTWNKVEQALPER